MNVIDHAILIPASPAFIWRYIGDVSQNTKWQENCTNIAFLTTQHEGRGTRWRYTTSKAKDVVIEITAWYDTLGYEYIIVDGSSVSENKGRIRLQEIAEGTLVQWTFNYEVDGVLSGFRNSMGLKRSLTNEIQDSLRNLYKYIQTETGGISTHEAKALLKEAPDVEERSSYQPRHPSNFTDESDTESFDDTEYPSEQPISYNIQAESILEPPVADDDTKPNPVVQDNDQTFVLNDMVEPSFLHNIPEPPMIDDDTKPNAPIIEDEAAPAATVEQPEAIRQTQQTPTLESTQSEPQQDDATATPSPDKRDTATVSVFELFGLQKPSDTQEMAALSDEKIKNAEPVVPTPPAALEHDDEVDISSTLEDSTSPAVEQVEQVVQTVIDEAIPDSEVSTPEEVQPVAEAIDNEALSHTAEPVSPTDIESADELEVEQLISDTTTPQYNGLRWNMRQQLIQLRIRK